MQDFARFAEGKTRLAERARIMRLETIDDRSRAFPVDARIGNAWTREHYDGDFLLLPSGREGLPAVSLTFVQSRDGNTGADNPADLGGGDTDLHLIYEGLSRVAADAVLAGAATARGDVFFSVWHPQMVALRAELGLPRHPAQVVVSEDGNVDLEGTLLFNVPDARVYILAGMKCEERCRRTLGGRPWIHVIPLRDLPAALGELRQRGIHRISAIGGRSTASALIDAGLAQDVCLTTTSKAGGQPDTPFYRGPRRPSLQPIVRKRSTGTTPGEAIMFEHASIA
jgi:riboflavin biosynthesis pyrimidine reductase